MVNSYANRVCLTDREEAAIKNELKQYMITDMRINPALLPDKEKQPYLSIVLYDGKLNFCCVDGSLHTKLRTPVGVITVLCSKDYTIKAVPRTRNYMHTATPYLWQLIHAVERDATQLNHQPKNVACVKKLLVSF